MIKRISYFLKDNKKELSVVEALQQDEVAASERAELQKSEDWATNKIFDLFNFDHVSIILQ